MYVDFVIDCTAHSHNWPQFLFTPFHIQTNHQPICFLLLHSRSSCSISVRFQHIFFVDFLRMFATLSLISLLSRISRTPSEICMLGVLLLAPLLSWPGLCWQRRRKQLILQWFGSYNRHARKLSWMTAPELPVLRRSPCVFFGIILVQFFLSTFWTYCKSLV